MGFGLSGGSFGNTLGSKDDNHELTKEEIAEIIKSLPKNPDKLPQNEWKEITRPEASKEGLRTFEHNSSKYLVRYDEGKIGRPGHEGRDHYHFLKPRSHNSREQYFDNNGNFTNRGSNSSHIYPGK